MESLIGGSQGWKRLHKLGCQRRRGEHWAHNMMGVKTPQIGQDISKRKFQTTVHDFVSIT